jgi:hypothetical protein
MHPTSYEAIGIEASFETTPPAFSAAQAGWVELALGVSKTTVFEIALLTDSLPLLTR